MRNITKKKKCLLFKHEKNNQTLSNDWPTYCHTGISSLLNKLLLPMQSVHITTNVVSSNPAHGEVYSTQHYVYFTFPSLRVTEQKKDQYYIFPPLIVTYFSLLRISVCVFYILRVTYDSCLSISNNKMEF
jgi:hypothetical protein